MGVRYLFFSNECVGLGHLRRALALAQGVTEADATASALVVSGSALASGYRLPPRVDTVKLPLLTRDHGGRHHAGRLDVDLDDIVEVRGALAAAAATAYAPDVVVVDKTPLGLNDELVPALEAVRPTARLVLGMRDVDDTPERVRRRWVERGWLDALRRYYDAVLVYGPSPGIDALANLGAISPGLPVHRVGYVGMPVPERWPADLHPGYVLVTAGGGVDGGLVLSTYLAALRLRPVPVPSVLVTGPLVVDGEVDRLRRLAAGLDVRVLEFRSDMEAVVVGARAVVAMAGYNTVSEVLRAGKPALLVPRVRPSGEQLIRARSLARQGQVEMLHPDGLTAEAMRRALDRLLTMPEAPAGAIAIRFDGVRRATAILGDLATDPVRRRARALAAG